MGKPWSEARHLKIAERRMKDVESGKAKTFFFCGPVAELKKGRWLVQFGVFHKGMELEVSWDTKGKGKFDDYVTIWNYKWTGKAFQTFVQRISEWLRFPIDYTVYKKKVRK